MVGSGTGAHAAMWWRCGRNVVGLMEIVGSRKWDDYAKLTDLSGQQKED